MRVRLIGFRHHDVRPSPIELGEPAAADLEAAAELFRAAGMRASWTA